MLVTIKGRDTSCKGRPKLQYPDKMKRIGTLIPHSKYLQRVSGHVNVRSPKTFTVCESRHFLEVSTNKIQTAAMKCDEHVYPWQKWALTFSFSSYCILIAAWCRQDGREQSVHQRWAEHVRWSSQHERRIVQNMPGHQTSRPTESWASNQIPKFGHFILNPSLLKQHKKMLKVC